MTVLFVALGTIEVMTIGRLQGRVMGETHQENYSSVLVRSNRPIGRHLFSDWYVVDVTAQVASDAVREAKRISGVLYAEPDVPLRMHDARCPPAEWYIANVGQFGGAESVGVDARAWEAWAMLRTSMFPNPVRIAVVDSGVDTSHPRFKDVTFYAQRKFTEDAYSVRDLYGHGTAVAGVIAAMLPVASWYELGSYRMFDVSGTATYSVLIAALQAAVTDGSKIVNFSGGAGVERSDALRSFLASHPETLFIFSAGNSGASMPEYPALYHDLSNVVSVAANEQSGALTSFTNVGALLIAPGQYILPR